MWPCHIGVGRENDATGAGWNFLRPHLTSAQAYVFSRRAPRAGTALGLAELA